MSQPINPIQNKEIIQECKAQLKAHLKSSQDNFLKKKIEELIAPKCLLAIEEFQSAEHIARHVRKVLSITLLEELEKNGVSAMTNWALGLLNYPGVLPLRKQKQSAKQISLIKMFYCKFLAQLLEKLKTQASFDAEGIRWIFELVDQWRLHFETVIQLGFTQSSAIRVSTPEPNIYSLEDDASYLNLMHIFKALQTGKLAAIPWRQLSPKEQFGGYLFFMICLSGASMGQLKFIAQMSLIRKALDAPFSSLLLPLDSSLKLSDVYDLAGLQSGENQTYRWIPDPVSAALYQRLRKNWNFGTPNTLFCNQCIQDFMGCLQGLLTKQIQSSKSSLSGGQVYLLKNALTYFTNTTLLIKASKVYQTRTLPAVIWHRLARDIQTKDLGFSSLDRLGVIELSRDLGPNSILNARTTVKRMSNALEPTEEIDALETDTPEINTTYQPHWVQSCLTTIDSFKNGRLMLADAVLKIQDLAIALELGPDTLTMQLAGWMGWIIHTASPKNRSLLEHPQALLNPMMALYEIDADFNDLDAPSRIDEFDVLETESHYNKIDQEKLRRAWNSFHLYLIEVGHIDSCQFTPIKMNSKLSRVGAEYISIPEFELAREVLYSKQEYSLELRNTCTMVLTLSYRLGLRRSEVSKLSTAHVSFLNGVMSALSIQWWIWRRLKTPSSSRILPIKGLLDERECLWLELFVAARSRGLWILEDILHASKETLIGLIQKYKALPLVNTKNFLFLKDEYLNGQLQSTSAVDQMIKLIHDALREPGGASENLRFHHLRHSCATNTLIFLLSQHLPNSYKFILNMVYGNPTAVIRLNAIHRDPLDKNYSNINTQSQDFEMRAQRARGILLGGDESSGSDVYAVSRLLGHSSPMTTLTSYIHVIDLLVGAFLNERFYKFSDRLKSAIHVDFKLQLENRVASSNDKSNEKTLLSVKTLGRPRKTMSAKELKLLGIAMASYCNQPKPS